MPMSKKYLRKSLRPFSFLFFLHNGSMTKSGLIFLTICFCLCCFVETAAAESLLPKGSFLLKKNKLLPPATVDQVDVSLHLSQQCWQYKHSEAHYDCDCVGMKALDMLRADPKISYNSLLVNAQLACPNTAGTAGQTYERCLAWAPREIGENYKAFCECYGNTYANLYGKNPSDSPNLREANMVSALTSCKLGDIAQQQSRHTSWIEKLKAQGLYKILFPSAVDAP